MLLPSFLPLNPSNKPLRRLLLNFLSLFTIAISFSACGASAPGAQISACTNPDAPTGVVGTAGDKQVSLSWTSVSGASSYNVYWATAGGQPLGAMNKISTIGTPQYTHVGLTNGTTYYYKITASNGNCEGQALAEASAKPSAAGTGGSVVSVTPVTVTSSAPLTINGSVGDGPVTGATITIKDSTGAIVAGVTAISDGNAKYTVIVPKNTYFPISIISTGGVDIVTNEAPTISLESLVTPQVLASGVSGGGSVTTNVNPFTTIIKKTAESSAGGAGMVDGAALASAQAKVLKTLNFGLPANIDPFNTATDSTNVAAVVKANEAIAEFVKKVVVSVTSSATVDSAKTGDVIKAISADMAKSTSGAMDGAGTSGSTVSIGGVLVDPKLLAVSAQTATVEVVSKVASNTMTVTKSDGTVISASATIAKLNTAVTTSVTGATAKVENVPVTLAMANQITVASQAVSAVTTGTAKVNAQTLANDLVNKITSASANGAALSSADISAITTDLTTVSATGNMVSAVVTPSLSANTGALTNAVSSVTTASAPAGATTVTVSPSYVALYAVGATAQLSAVAKDGTGAVVNGATMVWSSSNPAVATVSATGLVTAVAGGTATITATTGGKSGTAQADVVIINFTIH